MAEHTRLLRVSGALCESLRMSENSSPTSAKVSDAAPRALFGLVFMVMSLLCAFQVAHEIKIWKQAANWDETPCWIEQIDIEKVLHGKGSPTWESRVVYRYQHAGKEHRNTTISLRHANRHRAPLPDGTHTLLQTHLEAGSPYRCFVNAACPDEAVLFRELNTRDLMFYGGFMILAFSVGLPAMLRGIVKPCRQKEVLATWR
jgi:hypothetical protein